MYCLGGEKMNPTTTTNLYAMNVHVFNSEEEHEQAKLEEIIGENDLVITPDEGVSILQQMQNISNDFKTGIESGEYKGKDGATFTPSLSEEGLLSWTNDQGLQNPAAVSIRGPQGPTGPQGTPAVLSTHTGTLLLGEWVNAQQAVGISEIVPESLVIVSPTPESFSVYSAAGTRAFALAEGSVGFTYDTLPTDDMTVNIMILNGTGGGQA